MLTVTAASTAPAIPPENSDNAGDIRCLPACSGFGFCVVLLGLAKLTVDLAVETIEAIVSKDSCIVSNFFSKREVARH